MGIFSELKRLFWVKKAVAKSAAEKAVEEGRDFIDDFTSKKSQETHKTEKPVGDWDKKADWTQEKPIEASRKEYQADKDSTAYKMGDKLGAAAEKAGDAAGKAWDKAKEEGKELLDKAVKTSDKVWEKAEDVSGDLWTKAKDAANKAGEKFQEGVDSMLEKAKELDKKIEEERDKIDPNRDGWADQPVSEKLREHESTLKGKDDFFEKAQRYAEGDYSMGKPVVIKKTEDEDQSTENLEPLPPLPEDDIADDAILDDGDEPKK